MTPSDDDRGLTFARDDRGKRSTVAFGREIVAAALDPVAPAAAAAARAERVWRRGYPRHFRALVEASAADAAATLAVARAGLAAAAARLRFVRDGESSLAEAMAAPRRELLRTASVRGGDAPPAPLTVPYRGRTIAGDALLRQLDDWVARDIVEPSFAQALRLVHDHPDWLDLADQTIVLLGAGAEMGPFEFLVKRRAQIVAVDLARPAVWHRLIAAARAGNGTLHLPVRGIDPTAGDKVLAGHAGADLLTETPEIASWIGSFEAPLTVGAYAYLDGVLHLRVAAAMDAIQASAAARPDATLAMLGTPTDVVVVPAELMATVHQRYAQRPLAQQLWQQPLQWISGGRLFARNVAAAAGGHGIVDALIVQQGPNYALAKRLQQWRALAARADGHCVSARVAPPSLTGSVLSNPLMGAAYRSAAMFGVEAFEPATASVLMAVLLVHDLRNPRSAARPATPLAQPLLLFADAAHHGGLWRSPFAARSALPVAALAGYLRRSAPPRS